MRRTALAMATALLLGGTALAAAPEGDTGAATVHPELWPAAQSPAAITDAATEPRLAALIARLPIEQKVGQSIQHDLSTVTPSALETLPIGLNTSDVKNGPPGQ